MWTRFPTREAALGGFVCMRVTDCCVIMITTYVARTRDCYRSLYTRPVRPRDVDETTDRAAIGSRNGGTAEKVGSEESREGAVAKDDAGWNVFAGVRRGGGDLTLCDLFLGYVGDGAGV